VLTWSGVLRLPQIVVRSAEERAPASDPPAETPVTRRAPAGPHRVRFEGRLWRAWMPDPLERAIFRLCATQLARDRSLKVRLAAALAYFLVFPFVFLFEREGRAATLLPFVFVWFCAIIPLTVLELLRISAVPDSAELFLFTPIAEPVSLLHGARKAALVFIVFPIFLYTLAISAWSTHGAFAALWIAAPVLFLVHPMSMMPGWRGDYVPLSQAPRTGERSAQVLGMFLAMAPLGVLCALVMIANEAGFVLPAVAAVAVIAVVAHFVLRRWIRGRSLNALKRS
jgi:hypothetical protein